MHKINFITPIVFETLKLKNPAIWLDKSIFAFNHAQPKLHDQFVALIDMKLHAQNQLYNSFSFWDHKVLIAFLGMPHHTHLKSHHQFLVLIDMYLHAKNQLYTSHSFWDIKGLAESIFAYN